MVAVVEVLVVVVVVVEVVVVVAFAAATTSLVGGWIRFTMIHHWDRNLAMAKNQVGCQSVISLRH